MVKQLNMCWQLNMNRPLTIGRQLTMASQFVKGKQLTMDRQLGADIGLKSLYLKSLWVYHTQTSSILPHTSFDLIPSALTQTPQFSVVGNFQKGSSNILNASTWLDNTPCPLYHPQYLICIPAILSQFSDFFLEKENIRDIFKSLLVTISWLHTAGQSHNHRRTILTCFAHVLAIYRYFIGRIGKIKVYQFLAHVPPFANKLLSRNYLKNFINN